MRTSGRVVAAGAAIAFVYVAVGVATGRHVLIARRPVFDGFSTTHVPYNWVSPPPALRTTNKAPASGRFQVDLAPDTGSQANVFSTTDGQISLALAQGAIPAQANASGALLTLTPLAATGFGPAPGGRTIVGNVIRIRATYQPGGTPVTAVRIPGQLVLLYPAPPTTFGYTHTLLSSPDGRTWTPLRSIESAAQLLVQANVSTFGYFAVAQARTGPVGNGTPIGKIVEIVLGVLIVVVVVGAIGLVEIRLRRRRREGEGPRGERRDQPPPKGRKKIDPWD